MGWLSKLLRKPSPDEQVEAWQEQRYGKRRRRERGAIEAADTNRLNARHWTHANDSQTINDLLAAYLGELRGRARLESINNPLVEGVINTYCDDFVGEAGPTLQVQSDSDRFNEALEREWRAYFEMPDAAGMLSGPEVITLDVETLWTCGEFLTYITPVDGIDSPIAERLRLIHPRRMDTPGNMMGDGSVVLGVRRNKFGRPMGYFVDAGLESAVSPNLHRNYVEYPAADIIHGFCLREPDQVRGVPWLTSALPVIADLRDYDAEVLDAARSAANFGAVLTTQHPESQFLSVNASESMERRQITTAPPGWELNQLRPEQPHTAYAEYRAERLRELGRPRGMPLMMVQLDARKHNYSSARFDDQGYARAMRKAQAWYARVKLKRLVDLVARIGRVAGVVPPRPAGEVRYIWTWPKRPHIDELKSALAATERLNNGTSSLHDECIALGRDFDQLLPMREREKKQLEAAGLPTHPVKSGKPAEEEAEDAGGDSDKD
jgi:lambda family phage portal protein